MMPSHIHSQSEKTRPQLKTLVSAALTVDSGAFVGNIVMLYEETEKMEFTRMYGNYLYCYLQVGQVVVGTHGGVRLLAFFAAGGEM